MSVTVHKINKTLAKYRPNLQKVPRCFYALKKIKPRKCLML